MRNRFLLFVIFSAFLFSCRNENRREVPASTSEKERREMAAIEDTIRVYRPRPGERIESPVKIRGRARGYWFFEGSFTVRLLNENEEAIAVAIAEAQDDWMTEDWVEFEATLELNDPDPKEGVLVFEKANPSGLEEHERELRIPVRME